MIFSLTEEAEAINWYEQRIALEKDKSTPDVFNGYYPEERRLWCMIERHKNLHILSAVCAAILLSPLGLTGQTSTPSAPATTPFQSTTTTTASSPETNATTTDQTTQTTTASSPAATGEARTDQREHHHHYGWIGLLGLLGLLGLIRRGHEHRDVIVDRTIQPGTRT